MKRIFLSFLIVLAAAGYADAKNFEAVKKSGDYSVAIAMDKASPGVGQNNIQAVIKDKQGKTVTDAAVVFEYSMPAMPGMPAMNYKANAKLEDGAYRAVLDLSMSGPWTVTVKFTRAGKTHSVRMTVDVR